ncbi:MAG TPA: glycosyltransferase [Armatimonadota bacterium]|nr:glycosyltransferase [Armatimonadota bacterium]
MNAANARISVVLPTYNHADFLDQAVDSVIAQTRTDWELILIDDGSSDNTLPHLARVRDPRIVVVQLPHNLGLPRALNVGFARAIGEYLTWTSADNEMLPPCLASLSQALDQHPEVGLVYAGHEVFGDRDAVKRKAPYDAEELRGGQNVVGPCFMYRREVMETVGTYDPDCFGAEDYDMWLRISRRHDMLALQDVLYRYRVHARTLTAQSPQMVADATQWAMEKQEKWDER